jgi:hypothetical protein
VLLFCQGPASTSCSSAQIRVRYIKLRYEYVGQSFLMPESCAASCRRCGRFKCRSVQHRLFRGGDCKLRWRSRPVQVSGGFLDHGSRVVSWCGRGSRIRPHPLTAPCSGDSRRRRSWYTRTVAVEIAESKAGFRRRRIINSMDFRLDPLSM